MTDASAGAYTAENDDNDNANESQNMSPLKKIGLLRLTTGRSARREAAKAKGKNKSSPIVDLDEEEIATHASKKRVIEHIIIQDIDSKLKLRKECIDNEMKEINDTLMDYSSSDDAMKDFYNEAFAAENKSIDWFKKRIIELRLIKLKILQTHNDSK